MVSFPSRQASGVAGGVSGVEDLAVAPALKQGALRGPVLTFRSFRWERGNESAKTIARVRNGGGEEDEGEEDEGEEDEGEEDEGWVLGNVLGDAQVELYEVLTLVSSLARGRRCSAGGFGRSKDTGKKGLAGDVDAGSREARNMLEDRAQQQQLCSGTAGASRQGRAVGRPATGWGMVSPARFLAVSSVVMGPLLRLEQLDEALNSPYYRAQRRGDVWTHNPSCERKIPEARACEWGGHCVCKWRASVCAQRASDLGASKIGSKIEDKRGGRRKRWHTRNMVDE
ncbi:uncharacterized protein C8Q71DRAFT_727318 [Rhodofomes roseus]|uniref:Uncharacterized protein n=1 Tax=Rhodofomes roseus TaxID=34475 RepID=A0ABQ8K2A8_9APHY|nr:uncharacterized protein C8Q71DRAFT_727318 [Rhodofomes roseus]KAH9830862.1 hypothetical protein C8Q71DRAFT_727318 [Rhodofomes roseus]